MSSVSDMVGLRCPETCKESYPVSTESLRERPVLETALRFICTYGGSKLCVWNRSSHTMVGSEKINMVGYGKGLLLKG